MVFCWVILVGLILLVAMLSLSPNHGNAKKKARIIRTRIEERDISNVLTEQINKHGSLEGISNGLIFQALLEKDGAYGGRTNNIGQICDVFGTPYRIDFKLPATFAIYSAGPNLKFDDEDDIVFNSISNDFVKP